MEPTIQPLVPPPAPTPVQPEPASTTTTSGLRRAVLTAAISGLLLVGGAVAVVSAASPDPSAAPSTAPSTQPGTAAPSTGTPRQHTGSSADCPNMGGNGGSNGSGGSPTTPSTTPSTAPTPAT